jgi:hypothetical protein
MPTPVRRQGSRRARDAYLQQRLDATSSKLFVVTAVFGDAGDPYRHGHGDPEAGVRRQVLFGIAALAGWLQEFSDYEALEVLARRTRQALSAVIGRARRPRLPPGDS